MSSRRRFFFLIVAVFLLLVAVGTTSPTSSSSRTTADKEGKRNKGLKKNAVKSQTESVSDNNPEVDLIKKSNGRDPDPNEGRMNQAKDGFQSEQEKNSQDKPKAPDILANGLNMNTEQAPLTVLGEKAAESNAPAAPHEKSHRSGLPELSRDDLAELAAIWVAFLLVSAMTRRLV